MSSLTKREATAVAPGRTPGSASDALAGRVDVGADARAEVDDVLVVEDLLVEDVSIDGMCGVY
jgi:mycofactocin precursor